MNGKSDKNGTTPAANEGKLEGINYACNFFGIRLPFLQRFGNVAGFTAFYSIGALCTQTLAAYIGSQIPTLEKQFGLSSYESGIIMTFNDIGFLLCILVVSAIPRLVHVPRWLFGTMFLFAISGIICSLPHFIFPTSPFNSNIKDNMTDASSSRKSSFELCSNEPVFNQTIQNKTRPSEGQTTVSTTASSVKAISLTLIGIGMSLQGVAKAPRAPFTTVYLDDGCDKRKTGFFLGIIIGSSIFGPAISYGLGGFFSRIYVTLEVYSFLFSPCAFILTATGNGTKSQTNTNQQTPPRDEPSKETTKRKVPNNEFLKKHEANNPVPVKRGKPNKHDGNPCGPCTIWIQTGSYRKYEHLHNMNSPCHPNQDAENFSHYLSTSLKLIRLSQDSCICKACYSDVKKNISKSDCIPRWQIAHQSFDRSMKDKHCLICHNDSLENCSCHESTRWYQSSVWIMGSTIEFWQNYFEISRINFSPKLKSASVVCQRHYMEMYHFLKDQKCISCNKKFNEYKFVIKSEETKAFVESLPNTHYISTSVICVNCTADALDRCKKSLLQKDLESKNEFTKIMAVTVKESIEQIEKNGYMLRKEIAQDFRNKRLELCTDIESEIKTFDNFLGIRLKKYEHISSIQADKRFGALLFNNIIISDTVANKIYNLLKHNASLQNDLKTTKVDSCVKFKDIHKMIEEQAKLFIENQDNFDARNLFDNEKDPIEIKRYFLEQYLHQPLVTFIEQLLNVDNVNTKKQNLTDYKLNLKIQAIIALLCNAKYPRSIMLQTVIGLTAYAYGLRDKGFKILNYFGMSCGIDYVRKQASRWATMRKVTDEVDKHAFWRVSFDNLNFKRKFAKTFTFGADVLGRMLNLITGQVSHRTSANTTETLQEQSRPETISEEDFFMYKQGRCKTEWFSYIDNIYDCQTKREDFTSDAIKTSLMQDIQCKMKCFSSSQSDVVAYATVKSAQAAKINDVSNYLNDLKTDLNIGRPGYPDKVVVAGDQQTYAIVKNLIRKYPSTFSWIIPVPGDWHLLKNAAETIRDMLWDGGFHDLGKACGHLKEITQWRDIHNMIIAIHEALTRQMVNQYNISSPNKSLEEWIQAEYIEDNDDEISKFWAMVLRFLNAYIAYYLSIRSGNFTLRNAALPILTELFFSYSHDKYEELACQTINDVLTLPTEVLNKFMNGEWVIDKADKQFHSVALDEGHEQYINKRLKELTTRPSEFRTVTLANFMAYLDKFLHVFQTTIFQFRKKPTKSERFQLDYIKKILSVVEEKDIFAKTKRELCNIFSEKPFVLDNETKHDLLNVSSEGKSRMTTYIRQYVLQPPIETPKKKIRRKMKTFSKRKTTQRTQKTQLNQVSLLLKRAYTQLQKEGHYIDKTIEFPLALCNEFGEMRSRQKSKLKDYLQSEPHFEPMFSFTNSLTTDMQQKRTEIIIDFLKYLHEPTPPDLKTFNDLAHYYWTNVIQKVAIGRHADIITIIIDKDKYLSPIRNLVHTERQKKSQSNEKNFKKIIIADNSNCLHGTDFTSALRDSTFKKSLIEYITSKFTEYAKAMNTLQTVILDTPLTDKTPVMVKNKTSIPLIERTNNKGEADCCIWFHASKSPCEQILIIANDTDIWMYGVALLEAGYLRHVPLSSDKNVVIELGFEKEYVNLNLFLQKIQSHESFETLEDRSFLGCCFLAIYLLSGSDYISNYFGVSIKKIMQCFFSYASNIINSTEPLVNFHKIDNKMSFQGISTNAYCLLMSFVYLEKHSMLFKHIAPTPPLLYSAFRIADVSLSSDMKSLLGWLGYDVKDNALKITTIHEWVDFTRRTSYFCNHGSKNLYKLMLPTYSALNLHKKRGEFVMHLACESVVPQSEMYSVCYEYGWKEQNNLVSVTWDTEIESTRKQLVKRRPLPVQKCSCKAANKCSIESKGCKNCTKKCRPCTNLCLCKGDCFNPHNNGGNCDQCTKDTNVPSQINSHESEDDDTISDQSDEDHDSDEEKNVDSDFDFTEFFKDNTFLSIPDGTNDLPLAFNQIDSDSENIDSD